jgi:hypothetical protein
MITPVCLLVAEKVQRQEIFELAARRGWRLQGERLRTHEAYRAFSWEVAPGKELTWQEDHGCGVRLLLLHPDLAAEVKGALATVERAEALALAGSADAVAGLRGLSLLVVQDGSTPGPDLQAELERWLQHPSSALRRAVCRLLAVSQARALLPLVERAGKKDPDAAVRKLFQLLAKLLRTLPGDPAPI